MSDLTALYERCAAARQRYQFLGATNTDGLSPPDRAQLDIAYEQAKETWLAEYQAYTAAIRKKEANQ